jgi:hypothetical protein
MHDVAAEAIKDGNQKIESPSQIQVTDVNMPFLMDFVGLNESWAEKRCQEPFIDGRGGEFGRFGKWDDQGERRMVT